MIDGYNMIYDWQDLKDIAKAIELSVEAMLESDADIKVVSGETH